MNIRYIYILLILLFVSLESCKTKSKPLDPIEELLSQMTLKEKIGQMNQYSGFWDATGPAPSEGDQKTKYDHLKSGRVGAILNVHGAENVRKMQETAVEGSRLGIPLLFGFDVIHGHKTISPIPLAESSSWDLEAIENSARIAAIEASASGINWTFAPMVDVSRDPRWGRVMEGSGEDPFLGSKIGIARVKGFQGDDLKRHNTILATAKHFAGYGFVDAGREYNTVDIGTSTLYNIVLPPFKSCVDTGVGSIMNSFNILNGIPATGDAFLQRDILKGKWNFNGFVVSDWSSVSEMITHGYVETEYDATATAVNAGCDMDMESHIFYKYLEDAIEKGEVPESNIDDAVRRILKVKRDLGLFEDPYLYCNTEREKELIYHEDHMNAVLDLAKKSIVLLKNEDGILPLSKKTNKLAVIGPLAADKNSPLGNWRLGATENTAVSVLEGLDNARIDYKYAKGVDFVESQTHFALEVQANEKDRAHFNEAIELAKNSETVIMVLGEHGLQSGEGRSRTELSLPGLQQELLEKVYNVNKNIILVVMSGRPLVLSWADEYIPAIVQAWQLGTQSGNAISSVLFGDHNPQGKLTMSFPRSVGQIPVYYNQMRTGRPTSSGDVFWTHYIDEENSPLYPFGYGLSYSNFEYSQMKVDNNYKAEGKIRVSVNVKNTSDREGTEVVQLYIRDHVSSVVRPVKELKGFDLVLLAKGEDKTVEFILDETLLGFYDQQGIYVVEAGRYSAMIGPNSRDLTALEFTID